MSIIERNIAELGEKFLENIEYEDLDYRGFVPEGQTLVITGSSVLVNDLKLWLQSSKGDYYRRWNMGGYFDDNLRAFPLNDDGAEALKADLISKVQSQFETIEILDLAVEADIKQRGWKLRMVIRDKLTGALAPFDTGLQVE